MSPARKGAVPRRGGKGPAKGPAARNGAKPPKGGGKRTGSKGPAGSDGRSSSRGAPTTRRGGSSKAGAAPARSRSSRPGVAAGRQAAARGLGGDQVEGRQAVRELLLAGTRRVREILIEEDLPRSEILDDIRDLATEVRCPVQEVSAGRLRSMAKTEAPQGVVARAQELAERDLDDLVGPACFLLAFDGVTDPGNLGAALRSAEGAGVTGVVLPRHRAVHITPTVAKSAAGAIEHLPMALVGGMPAAIDRLKAAGVWVVGLDAAADRTVHDLAVGADPVALVLGAEGRGLSRLVRQRCDVLARIPLSGHLASLNVAAATAVATFEVRRQRDQRP